MAFIPGNQFCDVVPHCPERRLLFLSHFFVPRPYFRYFRWSMVSSKLKRHLNAKNTFSGHDSIHGHRNLNYTERSTIARHRNFNAPKICKITVLEILKQTVVPPSPKKLRQVTQAKHRRVHARQITRLCHERAVVSIFLVRVVDLPMNMQYYHLLKGKCRDIQWFFALFCASKKWWLLAQVSSSSSVKIMTARSAAQTTSPPKLSRANVIFLQRMSFSAAFPCGRYYFSPHKMADKNHRLSWHCRFK